MMLVYGCFLCLRNEENSVHLLLSCPFALQTWKENLLGSIWVGWLQVPLRNTFWVASFVTLRRKVIFYGRSAGWKQRGPYGLNETTDATRTKVLTVDEVAQLIEWRCASWVVVLPELRSYSVEDIARNWWDVFFFFLSGKEKISLKEETNTKQSNKRQKAYEG